MIRMRASSDSALAISTSCCSPMRKFGDPAVGIDGDAKRRSRRSAAVDACGARSISMPAINGSRPRKMLSATLNSGTRFSSWWMMAMPALLGVAHAGERDGSALHRDHAFVVGVHAGKDFHQRRLAGAVLAHQRMDLAAAQVEVDVGSAVTPAKDFEMCSARRTDEAPGSARGPATAQTALAVARRAAPHAPRGAGPRLHRLRSPARRANPLWDVRRRADTCYLTDMLVKSACRRQAARWREFPRHGNGNVR